MDPRPPHRHGFPGNATHFDATNPAARQYVWNKVKQNYYDYGIKIFWLDEAEPEYTYYDFDLYPLLFRTYHSKWATFIPCCMQRVSMKGCRQRVRRT